MSYATPHNSNLVHHRPRLRSAMARQSSDPKTRPTFGLNYRPNGVVMSANTTVTTTTTTTTLRNLRRELISRGAKWNDIKDWSIEEAELALSQLKSHQYIKEPKEAVQKCLATVKAKRAYHKMWGITGAQAFLERFNPEVFSWDLCSEADEEVGYEVLERMVSKAKAKLGERELRHAQSGDNRSLYLMSPVLSFEQTSTGEKLRWRFSSDLVSSGLIARILEHKGIKVEGEPINLRLVNGLPEDFDKDEFNSLMTKEYGELRARSWLPSKGNLAWNWKLQSVKDLLLAAFPRAIEFTAYNHRLSAPLLPGGFLHGQTVLFKSPEGEESYVTSESMNSAFDEVVNEKSLAWALVRGEDMSLGEAQVAAQNLLTSLQGVEFARCWSMLEEAGISSDVVTSWEKSVARKATLYKPIPQLTDGSGLYNPNHPAMANLIARYGKVVFQFSLLREDGLFCKGTICPREGMSDDISIQLDPNQIKGAMKGAIEQGQFESNCYLGIMNAWNRKGSLPAGFEMLEMLKNTPNPEVEQLLMSLTSEYITKITRLGVDGLLQEAARDNDDLRLVVKLLMQLRAHGSSINPLGVPMVRSAIESSLKSKLWLAAQGAGISGQQKVAILDASVPEGTCVCDSQKIGSEVAVWRFPTLLPQGLVTCHVAPPQPHQLVDGKPIPNTIFLNPRDLTLRMQGDDDGDIVGVSNDQRVVALWKHKITNDLFQIEPKGEKFGLMADTPEGHKYGEVDPMGPIGLCCIMQAQLLAVGDWEGALGMAVLNQEAVDSAKKRVVWTDIQRASQMSFWHKDETGVYHLRPEAKLDTGLYEHADGQPYGWPGDYISDFVKERLAMFGCKRTQQLKPQPLAWRIQQELVNGELVDIKKRVSPSAWVCCQAKANGFEGGNWVHITHDLALRLWKEQESAWTDLLGSAAELNVRDLPFELLRGRGVQASRLFGSWAEYKAQLRGLKHPAGLSIDEHGRAFRSCYRMEDENIKQERISSIQAELNNWFRTLSPAQLLEIWYWELTPTWSVKTNGQAPRFIHNSIEGAPKVNRENYAFRAATFPGSPILALLGVDDSKGCPFLEKNNRGATFAAWFLKQEQPFQTLSRKMFANVTHGDEIKDDNGERIEFHRCPHCMETLQTLTVRGWREQRAMGEMALLRELTSSLNEVERPNPMFKGVKASPYPSEYGAEWGDYEAH